MFLVEETIFVRYVHDKFSEILKCIMFDIKSLTMLLVFFFKALCISCVWSENNVFLFSIHLLFFNFRCKCQFDTPLKLCVYKTTSRNKTPI